MSTVVELVEFALVLHYYAKLLTQKLAPLCHLELKLKPILRRKIDGDWYIYPEFSAHENFNNVHKKVQKGYKGLQKGYKIFKPTIRNVLSTGTNIVKNWLSLCLIRCVRFARYCGKMYSRHLFSYGGL